MAAGDVTISGGYAVSDTAGMDLFLTSITNLNTGSFAVVHDAGNQKVTLIAVEGA